VAQHAHSGGLAELLVVALAVRSIQRLPGDLGRAEQERRAQHEGRLEEERLRDLAHQQHLVDAVLHALELLALVAGGVVAEDAHLDAAARSGLHAFLEHERPGMLSGFQRLRHAVAEADDMIGGDGRQRAGERDRSDRAGETSNELHRQLQ
jgi:hypothetical protein